MSLVIVTYVPEGIVMASDSRQFITLESKTADGKSISKIDTINSDNVYKTYLLSKSRDDGKVLFEVGVQSFGQDLLGGISTASHIKHFNEENLTDDDDVITISKKLFDYFKESFPEADTGFHIAGYKKTGRISEPHVYHCHIRNKVYIRKNEKDRNIEYGAMWSGEGDVLSGIILPIVSKGSDGQEKILIPKQQIIWKAMALQDAIDFSIYAIRTTTDTMRFQARPKSVGGPIDVLVLTHEGSSWIQRKKLCGE